MVSNRPVAVIWPDGDGRIVAAFGIVEDRAVATTSEVVISGGPGAMGLTCEGVTLYASHQEASRGAVWGTIKPNTVGFLHQQLRHPGVLVDRLRNGSLHRGIGWHSWLGA